MRLDRCLFLGFLVVFAVLALSGCAQKLVCGPPNSIIGNSCCLDADSNNVCDSKEEQEEVELIIPEPEVSLEEQEEQNGIEMAAETFANTWDRKSYNALRNLFIKNYALRFNANEFNFLARKMDSSLGIQGVSLKSVDGDTAQYEIVLPKKTIVVSADIDEEDDEYLHEPFYFFTDLTPEAACGDDSSCFMDYALVSKDHNYCAFAGEFKAQGGVPFKACCQ
jgi:hypothetical protein